MFDTCVGMDVDCSSAFENSGDWTLPFMISADAGFCASIEALSITEFAMSNLLLLLIWESTTILPVIVIWLASTPSRSLREPLNVSMRLPRLDSVTGAVGAIWRSNFT